MEYFDCISGTRTVDGRVIRFRATLMPDTGQWTVRVVAPDGESEERRTYDVWAELPEMLDCAAADICADGLLSRQRATEP